LNARGGVQKAPQSSGISLEVMAGYPRADSRTLFAAAGLALGVCVSSTAAAAPENLREGLFRNGGLEARQYAAPPIARYVAEGGDSFVLDRSQGRVLLKFDDSPEVWVLTPTPAPRGDTIYKNDLGESVLRATRLGGVTVFTDERPEGAAAALTGTGAPLRLITLGPQGLLEHLGQASVRASHAAHRLIPFDADASPSSSSLIADAAAVVSEAVVRMAKRVDGRALLAKLKQVRLIEGRRPAVQLTHGAMQITVTPALGLAGRPSSERIIATVEKAGPI
jgi:hypothetical protein